MAWYICRSSGELINYQSRDNTYGLILTPDSSEKVWVTDYDVITQRLSRGNPEFYEYYCADTIKSVLEQQVIIRFGTNWRDVNLNCGSVKNLSFYISCHIICSRYSILYYDGIWFKKPLKSNIFLKI